MTQIRKTKVWVADAVSTRDGLAVLLATAPPLSGLSARPENKSAWVDHWCGTPRVLDGGGAIKTRRSEQSETGKQL